MQVVPKSIRAGRANLFLSDVFTEAFVQLSQTPLELYNTDGSVGAARGAARGIGYFSSDEAVFERDIPLKQMEPDHRTGRWNELYQYWKHELLKQINASAGSGQLDFTGAEALFFEQYNTPRLPTGICE